MNALPSISNQIDENKIFQIIDKNFSKLAPFWFSLITNWLVRSYNEFQDIDKFVILIYLINKNLVFYRKNGLIIDYDAFYEDKELEISKINISDIAHDLKMPKESVRRKILELENKNVIKKTGKKIFLNRSAFITAKAKDTLKDLCILIKKLNFALSEVDLNDTVAFTEGNQQTLGHIIYNPITDKLEADRAIVTTLNSLYLGEQHKMSSGSENIYFTNQTTNVNLYPMWGGIKDQSVVENQTDDGIYVPTARIFSSYGVAKLGGDPVLNTSIPYDGDNFFPFNIWPIATLHYQNFSTSIRMFT